MLKGNAQLTETRLPQSRGRVRCEFEACPVRGGDGAGELVRYFYCEANAETGAVTYEIDTTGLAAGTYEIIVRVTPGTTERQRIELVAASPSGSP